MPKIHLPLFLGIIVSACASAQPQSQLSQKSKTMETLEVMHCLKFGDLDWLANSQALSNAKTLIVGLAHDKTSYENHQDHIIVVVFENRTRGDVFDLTRANQGNRRIYKIENNGEFSLEHQTIKWPGEILGGNWTRDYMEKNIRRGMRGPRIRVQLKALLKPFPRVSCTSYVSDR